MTFSFPRKIAVFSSGEGTNAAQFFKHSYKKNRHLSVVLLVCNRKEAGVIARAKQYNISVFIWRGDSALLRKVLEEKQVQALVLAGFLRRIPSFLIEKYAGACFNIHPSLLPLHGGKGMYGMRVHESVLGAAVQKGAQEVESGITIHRLSEEYDCGEIVFQKKIRLALHGLSAKGLSKAVQKLEHAYYVDVVVAALNNSRNGVLILHSEGSGGE